VGNCPITQQRKPDPVTHDPVTVTLELLTILEAATGLSDLSPLKSVGLHKLKGNRAGQWAMTVNARWRICFRFKAGDAFDV